MNEMAFRNGVYMSVKKINKIRKNFFLYLRK